MRKLQNYTKKNWKKILERLIILILSAFAENKFNIVENVKHLANDNRIEHHHPYANPRPRANERINENLG